MTKRAAASRPARAIPTHAAAIEIRPSPRADSAILYPSPSAPSRLATGTSAPSKISSVAGQARMPILRSCAPNRNPGVPFSTRKAVIARAPAAGSSVAKTRYRSASGAFEIQIFVPFSR